MYFWPLLITTRAQNQTVQIGIGQLQSSDADNPGMVLAGSCSPCCPPSCSSSSDSASSSAGSPPARSSDRAPHLRPHRAVQPERESHVQLTDPFQRRDDGHRLVVTGVVAALTLGMTACGGGGSDAPAAAKAPDASALSKAGGVTK